MANRSDYARRAEPRSFRPIADREDRLIASRLITERQLECLAWVQQGKSATDIGSILGLSGRTVEKHIIKVCGHLGVKTRIQAVVRARELGLIAASAP
ncbi:MAG: helix-turn-helix transcriptional regulator [Phenylobacterium sp.]|uniref:helix-turn-helix domain-containing protein n=1 Tax=Phenylobacterium sp. TaxID=1871053 RepID=UPI002734552C|nr:helix-turn-helix transcriptional regulator [Phenylobacterium sp.]MDP3115922.1 helix-turn-helix transcriptional regulator [Phenylobacterium sp.]